jgi:hypothetical protein
MFFCIKHQMQDKMQFDRRYIRWCVLLQASTKFVVHVWVKCCMSCDALICYVAKVTYFTDVLS